MTVAVAVTAAQNVTGNQDITTVDLGGATPKAVLFIYARAPILPSGTPPAITDAGYSFGATDGTSQIACACMAKDGATTVGQVGKTNKCLVALKNDNTIHSEAEFVSFVPGGVRVNWTTAGAAAWVITALFFSGSDWTVAVGNSAMSQAGVSTTIGFQPDCVFLLGANDAMTGTIGTTRAKCTFGAATWVDGVRNTAQQALWEWGLTRQNVCVTSNPANIWAGYSWFSSGQFAIIVDRTATDITITTTDNPGSEKVGFLALKYNGSDGLTFSAGVIAPAEASGNQAFTGFGGSPQQFVMLLPAEQTQSAQFDWRCGIYVATPTKGGGMAIGATSSAAGATPRVYHSIAMEDEIVLLDQDGTVNAAATVASIDADGMTLNFTDAPNFDAGRGAGFASWAWPYITLMGTTISEPSERSFAWIID